MGEFVFTPYGADEPLLTDAGFIDISINDMLTFAEDFSAAVEEAAANPAGTVQVLEDAGSIVFLHRVAAGSATKSYGIHVAKLAGVPNPVLDRARSVLEELESHHRLNTKRPKIPPRPKRGSARRKPVDEPTEVGCFGRFGSGKEAVESRFRHRLTTRATRPTSRPVA